MSKTAPIKQPALASAVYSTNPAVRVGDIWFDPRANLFVLVTGVEDIKNVSLKILYKSESSTLQDEGHTISVHALQTFWRYAA